MRLPRPAPTEPAGIARVLREYSLIADGERGAVIGPAGDLGWLCVPRWDSAAELCLEAAARLDHA